jgi:23S rRNA (guanosine2251-2'-O)-methyltransferase
MLVIGKNPILEILRSNAGDLNKIILLKKVKPEKKLKEIVNLAEVNKVKILYLNYFDFSKYFDRKNKDEGVTQGVIGFVEDFKYKSLKEILDEIKDVKNPLILILDQLTDPHNLGAIIRSAVCLGADGIVIPRHNSAEVNHTVMKTSAGAVNYISIAKETNLSQTIEYLKKNGFWIIGSELTAEKFLYETDLKIPVGLIIGNEGEGIRKNLLEKCDIKIRIPMTGKIDSLNASVSAGIIIYEIFRQKN